LSHPSCSVVIPSYNRRRELEMVLWGLCRQTVLAGSFEVIVVLDGATDDSADMLREWEASGRLGDLRWALKKNGGPAAARNVGALMARAGILIFLDDDVVPEPGMVEAHLWHYRDGRPVAVLGDYSVVRDRDDSIYRMDLWAWWEDLFHRRALSGHKPCFRDFCTGNVSVRREDFFLAGGFDVAFHGVGREDYDLGYRLINAGVEVVSDRGAKALHFHKTRMSATGVIKATVHDAHGDVLLWKKYPELRHGLFMGHCPAGVKSILQTLAMDMPRAGDLAIWPLKLLLLASDRIKAWRLRAILFDWLRDYGYWRGVGDMVGSRQELRKMQSDMPGIPLQWVEIEWGLPPDLPDFWVDGPCNVAVFLRQKPVGTLHITVPVEAPLRPYLTEVIKVQLGEHLYSTLWGSTNKADGGPL